MAMALKKEVQQTDLLLFGIETERLLFKQVTEDHHADWLRFCAYPGSLEHIGLHEYPTAEEKNKAWYDRVLWRYENKLGGMNALIEKSSGKLVGQCGLLVQEIDGIVELEIGYSLMPEFRGKGFALEAANACKEYALKRQVADSLISVIHVENEASMRVARANGMEICTTTTSKGDPVHIFRIALDYPNASFRLLDKKESDF